MVRRAMVNLIYDLYTGVVSEIAITRTVQASNMTWKVRRDVAHRDRLSLLETGFSELLVISVQNPDLHPHRASEAAPLPWHLLRL